MLTSFPLSCYLLLLLDDMPFFNSVPRPVQPHHARRTLPHTFTRSPPSPAQIGLLLLHPRHLWLPNQDQTRRRWIRTSLPTLSKRTSGPSKSTYMVRTLLDPPHPHEVETHLLLQHLPVAGQPGWRIPTPGRRRRIRRPSGLSTATSTVWVWSTPGRSALRLSTAEALSAQPDLRCK